MQDDSDVAYIRFLLGVAQHEQCERGSHHVESCPHLVHTLEFCIFIISVGMGRGFRRSLLLVMYSTSSVEQDMSAVATGLAVLLTALKLCN